MNRLLEVAPSIHDLVFTHGEYSWDERPLFRLSRFTHLRKIQIADVSIYSASNTTFDDLELMLPPSIQELVITQTRYAGFPENYFRDTDWLKSVHRSDFPELKRVEIVCFEVDRHRVSLSLSKQRPKAASVTVKCTCYGEGRRKVWLEHSNL